MCSLGIEPTTFRSADAMFYHWATQEHNFTNLLFKLTTFKNVIQIWLFEWHWFLFYF